MIAIGNHFGGPEHQGSEVARVFSAALRAAAEMCGPDYEQRPWLNPIFIFPGSITKVEFEGMQLGHYSKKAKGLVVMIAVPEAVANGVGMREFIIESLNGASEMATEFFARKGETFNLLGAQRLIQKVDQKLAQL